MTTELKGHMLEVERHWPHPRMRQLLFRCCRVRHRGASGSLMHPTVQCRADSLLQLKNVLIAVPRSGEADVDRFW